MNKTTSTEYTQGENTIFNDDNPIYTFKEDTSDVVNSVRITPNGKYALLGSEDKTLKLWKLFP